MLCQVDDGNDLAAQVHHARYRGVRPGNGHNPAGRADDLAHLRDIDAADMLPQRKLDNLRFVGFLRRKNVVMPLSGDSHCAFAAYAPCSPFCSLILNWLTSDSRSRTSLFIPTAATDISSEEAALDSTIPVLSSIAVACFCVAFDIDASWSAIAMILSTIPFKFRPASTESCAPSLTCLALSSMRLEISLAEAALRSASLRTSSATTAKPLPCSPARGTRWRR